MTRSGKIGSAVIYALTRPVAVLPLSFHRRAGRFVGWLMRSVAHYRTDVVMANLARCFPDKKYHELKETSRRFYEHLGTLFCEAIWFGGHGPETLHKARIAHIENPELINDLYDKGKTVFVMFSHMGNWELLGGIRSYAYSEPLKWDESNVVVVYRSLHNAAWNRFIAENRKAPVPDRKHFEGLVESFEVMRYAVKNRRCQKIYHFNMDQYPYSESSKVPVRFMGQETTSMNGAPLLASRLGTAAVYLGMKIDEDGSYRWTYTLMAEDASQCTPESLLEKYYELLEKDLREQPWNYLWTHKRWK